MKCLGLGVTVAPVTATALAVVDDWHAGIASGVNNAVARVAQLLVVPVQPLLTGLADGGPTAGPALDDGFLVAMPITARLAATTSLLAATTSSPTVLRVDARHSRPQAPLRPRP